MATVVLADGATLQRVVATTPPAACRGLSRAAFTTYDAAGTRLEHLPYAASGITVQQPDAIATVEVEDSHGVPFLVGFVTEPTDVGPY